MSTPPQDPKRVAWRTIERVAKDAEADRVEPKTGAALDDELRAAGLADGAADDVLEKALAKAGPAKAAAAALVPPSPPRRRAVVAFALVAAAAVFALIVYRSLDRAHEVGQPFPGSARELRRQAFMDCGSQRWAACEEALDRARELDPAGEAMPLVRDARRRIDMAKHDGYSALPPVPQDDAGMMP